jgi:hypothetical protein
MIKKWRTVHLGRVHSPDALVLHYRQALENTTVVSIPICDSLQQEDEQFGGCQSLCNIVLHLKLFRCKIQILKDNLAFRGSAPVSKRSLQLPPHSVHNY